jgi:hypothetical protein
VTGALHPVPAEVRAGRRAGPLDVDLLPGALADVADPQVARRPIEAHPPRVAQAREPDLGPRARGAGRERVVGRDAVRLARGAVLDVDPEDLAEQGRERLAVALRVTAAAAVAERDEEHALRVEQEGSAVVVGKGLLDEEDR